MPENNERSAEFWRGAVEALGEATGARVNDCWEPKMSHQQQVARWDRYRTLLAAAEAREGGEPTAAEMQKALEKAHWIGCSPHEWPTVDDIPLLCHALIAEHSRAAAAAEVIEACEKALGTAECYLCIYENEQRHRDNWEGSEDQGILRADKDANAAALALCARWKEANGGKTD